MCSNSEQHSAPVADLVRIRLSSIASVNLILSTVAICRRCAEGATSDLKCTDYLAMQEPQSKSELSESELKYAKESCIGER